MRQTGSEFQLDTETFGEAVCFSAVRDRIEEGCACGPGGIDSEGRYQFCNDTMCLPPKTKTAVAAVDIDPTAKSGAISIPSGYTVVPTGAPQRAAGYPVPRLQNPHPPALGVFLLTAFGAGTRRHLYTLCVSDDSVHRFVLLESGDGVEERRVCKRLFFAWALSSSSPGSAVTKPWWTLGSGELGTSPWVNGFIGPVFHRVWVSLLGA